MIKFYYNLAPNPTKVALFLEEAGLPYEPIPVDTRKGDQHSATFRAINPNGKVPAIVDGDATVFDSNAILLYLAEKTGKFLPAEHAGGARPAVLVADVRGHRHRSLLRPGRPLQAPCAGEAAVRGQPLRVRGASGTTESSTRSSPSHRYMLGDAYTIVDMDVWGWARLVPFVLGDDAWTHFPNLKRLVDEINARPAAARALALKDRHSFKTELDDDARRHLFPQNVQPT